ncbi:MAG: ferritin-like domain-containing protein [Actinobacteria bacterium]|nr:ferritin-like domain-containing protein [Actinomycetota bacterium]
MSKPLFDSALPPLEELDTDSAFPEAAAAVDAQTRAVFLRNAGIGAGAVVGGGALLGSLPSRALGAGIAKSDIAILNFALTLEYLEAAFYVEAIQKGHFTGELDLFTRTVAAHEAAHVAFLKKALGSRAVAKPSFNFKDTTSNQAKFMATSQTLEDTGVRAYLGQAGNFKSKKLLGAAATILTVEARHAAWIRDLRGKGNPPVPAPASFQDKRTKAQILAAVKATGFIVG